ncbi:MAG: ribonuclease P protein component, partial [Planctomycetota bacterium]
AVGRNRTKRRLREAFRITRPELPAGLDIVCSPTRQTGAVTLAELCTELLRLCRKADGDPKLRAPAPAPTANGGAE